MIHLHRTNLAPTHVQPYLIQLVLFRESTCVHLVKCWAALHSPFNTQLSLLLANCLPLRRSLGAADLQQVIVILKLKVRENQGNGVSWLS